MKADKDRSLHHNTLLVHTCTQTSAWQKKMYELSNELEPGEKQEFVKNSPVWRRKRMKSGCVEEGLEHLKGQHYVQSTFNTQLLPSLNPLHL